MRGLEQDDHQQTSSSTGWLDRPTGNSIYSVGVSPTHIDDSRIVAE